MFGLTALGVLHTAISLIAVIAGLYVLLRDKVISPASSLGRLYIWTTVLTCLTSFGIFQHGGFGKAHALGILTLLVLFLAWIAQNPRFFGRGARYVETIAYSLTLFLHFVPAITETGTRLPLKSPAFTSPDDPAIQKMIGVVLLLFIAIFIAQFVKLRADSESKTLTASIG
jgi:uncharacterized membrane protein